MLGKSLVSAVEDITSRSDYFTSVSEAETMTVSPVLDKSLELASREFESKSSKNRKLRLVLL